MRPKYDLPNIDMSPNIVAPLPERADAEAPFCYDQFEDRATLYSLERGDGVLKSSGGMGCSCRDPEDIADYCFVLDRGKLAAEGTPSEILGNRELLRRTNLVHAHRHKHGSEVHTHPRG
jgi:hypothetical protein